MTSGCFRFDRFVLDPADRRLRRDDEPVELSGRYLDALALLVSEPGRLVSKERFLDEVWRGVPVTDEALTQCIKTLRRQLGDEAASPRFIETVPKHGYRFVAPVERVGQRFMSVPARPDSWRELWWLAAAGTIGGGTAGVLGGLFYGLAGASDPLQPAVGAMSMLLVLLCVTVLVALIGAAGVAFGIAAAAVVSPRLWPWSIVGGAIGGALVGAIVKLLGVDAFNLLLGHSPGNVTGASEGALLGGAIGLGAWLAARSTAMTRAIATAMIAGGATGILIVWLGGRLMGGSLDLLARSFPGSRLRLDPIGRLFGETGFGPISQTVTAALEAALFAGGIVGAMVFARRWLSQKPPS